MTGPTRSGPGRVSMVGSGVTGLSGKRSGGGIGIHARTRKVVPPGPVGRRVKLHMRVQVVVPRTTKRETRIRLAPDTCTARSPFQ